MKDLLHIEEQIQEFCGLPDFGYGKDNIFIDFSEENGSKWKPLTNLIHNPKRFDWLMNFIRLRLLSRKAKQEKEQEIIR